MATTPEKTPILFDHIVAAYKAMSEAATMQEIDGQDFLVYEGFMTKLFRDTLHLSVPYYTSVLRHLRSMDCIRQLRRGGSTTMSKWLLMKPPFLDEFGSKEVLQRTAKPGSLQQQVSDLNDRLTKVEADLEAILSDLAAEVGG